MQPQQPGYGTARTYLELLADLPWQIASEEHEINLIAAKERLDSEHYGLSKVKKRIIEYLAVRKVLSLLQSPSSCSWKAKSSSTICCRRKVLFVVLYAFITT